MKAIFKYAREGVLVVRLAVLIAIEVILGLPAILEARRVRKRRLRGETGEDSEKRAEPLLEDPA